MRIFDRRLEPKYEFLRHAVAEPNGTELLSLYKAIGDETAWLTARSNDVTPIVAHRLMEVLGEERVPERWRQAHEESVRLLTAYMAELDRIAAMLAEHDIPLIALKNSGITRGLYRCVGCSPMGDMDVLVRKSHFREAHRLLVEDGYVFEFRSPLEEASVQAAEESGGAEYWKTLPMGQKLWFELQWRPVAGRWIRPDQEPSADELMARSLSIEGSAVRLLNAEDNLLQVCLHAAKHTYVRAPGFRLNLDVDRITRFQPVDWDAFLGRVRSFRVRTPVFFALALPKALVGAPVPDEALNALAPAGWRARLIERWLYRVGLFEPEEHKFSNLSFLAFAVLMYDNLGGLLRAVFPDREWMRERYGFSNGLLLPVYHAKRFADLLFRRTL